VRSDSSRSSAGRLICSVSALRISSRFSRTLTFAVRRYRPFGVPQRWCLHIVRDALWIVRKRSVTANHHGSVPVYGIRSLFTEHVGYSKSIATIAEVRSSVKRHAIIIRGIHRHESVHTRDVAACNAYDAMCKIIWLCEDVSWLKDAREWDRTWQDKARFEDAASRTLSWSNLCDRAAAIRNYRYTLVVQIYFYRVNFTRFVRRIRCHVVATRRSSTSSLAARNFINGQNLSRYPWGSDER